MAEVSQAQFAAMKNCHPCTVSAAIQRGEVVVLESGRIDPDDLQNKAWEKLPRGRPKGSKRKRKPATA